jgi:hypothetical protein
MNGIHEVTGSIPVWSTNSKSFILNGRNHQPTSFIEPLVVAGPFVQRSVEPVHARRPVTGRACGRPARAKAATREADRKNGLCCRREHRSSTDDAMNWSPDPQSLRGRVAAVTGTTRGAGRGIAAALGEAGATVICTGRSAQALGSSRSDYDRPETIEETAELVTRLGGNGITIAVDHLKPGEVKTWRIGSAMFTATSTS